MTQPSMAPSGVNHLVLNVRDMEESHRFWTDVVGLKQVGELKPSAARPNPPKMRFYAAEGTARGHHHDIALVENKALPPPPAEWKLFDMPMAINHIAITFPSREAWLARLEHVQGLGVKFNRRVNHGMTHSLYVNDPNGYGVELLYDLPREVWQDDIDGALNYVEILPTEGKEALIDQAAGNPVFGAEKAPAE